MTEHGGAAALKQNNLAALRSALYHTDFATKKELAEQCRLSLAACTALLGEMIDDGQVLELAFAASNGGRPARRFSINPNYAHILCLYTDNNDAERSGIALRVCDLKGNRLQEKFCPLDDILPEDLTLFITQMVQADPLIRAVGIGISGVTDREGAIESLAFPTLNGFNPKKVLEEQLGITVITENDMHFTSYGFYVRNPCDHPYSLSVLYWPSHRSAGAGTVVDGHIIVGSTKYAGELISLPLINSTATKVETVSRMIHGDNIVPLMQTAAVCTIALLNPDILFLTGSATLNVREKDIIDYCKQSIPENHMPVFRMQADIHEEYMTGIFSLTRQALKFKH